MQLEIFSDQTEVIELKNKVEPYLGTLVLFFTEIKLLADVVEDPMDEEICWKLYDKDGEFSYDSCCIDFIPLKGKLADEQYNKLVNHWNLNYTHKAI
jgi:hypothetical protein